MRSKCSKLLISTRSLNHGRTVAWPIVYFMNYYPSKIFNKNVSEPLFAFLVSISSSSNSQNTITESHLVLWGEFKDFAENVQNCTEMNIFVCNGVMTFSINQSAITVLSLTSFLSWTPVLWPIQVLDHSRS